MVEEELKEEEFNFHYEWLEKSEETDDKGKEQLNTNDYELKILILASVLADNNLSFTGTLKTMGEWLGVNATKTTMKENLKNAIQGLVNKGYIETKIVDKKITIIITEKGLSDKKIYPLRKSWVQTMKKVKTTGISVAWIQLLKVWIYYEVSMKKNPNKETITNKEIADALCITQGTVINAFKALEKLKYFGKYAEYRGKKVKKVQIEEDKYVTIGTIHDLRISAFEMN